MHNRLGIALLALCAVLPGCAKDELEKELQAQLASGALGRPPCAPVSSNLRPVDQDFDDIRFELVPGAHRIVVTPGTSGWRMTFGVPELTVFAAAGFFSTKEVGVKANDGSVVPGREFRLTPQGWQAMAEPGRLCFDYSSYRSVEVIDVHEIALPERLTGLGRAYRVKYALTVAEPADWAKTEEFQYVFTKVLTVGTQEPQPAVREQTFILKDGVWLSERDAMLALSMDAAVLRDPRLRQQVEDQRKKLAEATAERRAQRRASVTPERIGAILADGRHSEKLEACLQLPLREADLTAGVWKQDGPVQFVLYEDATRRDKSRYEHAREFLRRLENAGQATAHAFDGEPFPGGRKGIGVRYVLAEAAAAGLRKPTPGCLPLGTARVESVRISHAASGAGTAFRGWARLAEPRPWTAALSAQFPNVRAILESGYGISGAVGPDAENLLSVQAHAPGFGLRASTSASAIAGPPAPEKSEPRAVDQLPDGVVRMQPQGCTVSDDGTEVSAPRISCTQARASRGFRSGKAYAEVVFRGKQKGARPDTWTNAAVTSRRFLSSVSTGAALFSFAGAHTKAQVKDGDLIGIALDMDDRVLYWHVNGRWKTGRPGSGIGEPMIDAGEEYFIAVSVQDKAESWRVNFGASPFQFPPPPGFVAYGARL